MSLILDALNRSRQNSEHAPGLSSNHFVESAAPAVSWWHWLLVGALGVAVLAIAWLLLERSPQPATTVAVPAALTAPAAQAPPTNSQSVPAPASKPEEARAQTPIVPVSRPPATAAKPAASQSAETLPLAVAVPAPVDARVTALYQQQAEAIEQAPAAAQSRKQQAQPEQKARAEKSVTSSREEEAIDIEQLLETAEVELANASLSEHKVPFLSTLSQQVKDTVPTIMYLRHDYSGDPAASRVHINGKTVRTGGSVGAVKVLEILPDSVVLEYKGSRFRLRALNSWVNL